MNMDAPKKDFFMLMQQKLKNGSLGDLISKIESRLDLTFEGNTPFNPNLCLKDAEEVRDEFKSTFTQEELFHYLWAIGANVNNFKKMPIPLPENTAIFLQLVRKSFCQNLKG
ncbi:hypothetical protein CLW00_11919 [Mongoliibacter ruber]|uniref:Uncharacterized protein n=2 Tax=Mongoliibacter ruber TaxID=1750599 RepID=A0A2T0WCX6_9BACT|nr:hypothetical protein CLW00_11919 [Mongoliibacter ruber]